MGWSSARHSTLTGSPVSASIPRISACLQNLGFSGAQLIRGLASILSCIGCPPTFLASSLARAAGHLFCLHHAYRACAPVDAHAGFRWRDRTRHMVFLHPSHWGGVKGVCAGIHRPACTLPAHAAVGGFARALAARIRARTVMALTALFACWVFCCQCAFSGCPTLSASGFHAGLL